MSDRIFLLDGHSLAHRAYYALPQLTNSDGEYTNSVFGFCRMLFKLLDEEDPELITVAFDKKAPTFRHEEYEEYKATRKKMPEELQPQIGLIKDVLDALNIPTFEIGGYEADDIIGTLARKAEEEGLEVNIVSGDRDTLQLVTEKTNVLYTKKGITNMTEYNLDKVREEYEMEPEKLVDMKGLMGDSSDNIPGVPGIGKVTATKLLQQFCSLEDVLENIDQVSGKKRKENLRQYAEQARMSKKLGKILTDIPLDIDLEDCQREEPAQDKIVEIFERLEFGSLLERFKEQQEIVSNDIDFEHLEEKGEIADLKNEIEQEGQFAFEIVLAEEKRPVFSEMQEILVTTGANKIYTISSGELIFTELSSLFTDPDIEKCLLHAKKGAIYLKRQGLELKGLSFDPLLAAYLLHPSDSLPELADILKEELDMKLEDVSKEEEYGFFLTHIFAIKEKYVAELKDKSLLELFQDIELPLINVLAEMEINGIKVDVDFLHQLSEKYEEKLESITEKAHQLAGEEFNLNSPQQLSEILFEKLGLPVIKETKTGYSTSIDVLEELEDKHEIIPLIMDYRQWSKFKSTYVDPLPELVNPETQRIHTSFNQMVTSTGRLSSTRPNLQNIPIRTEEGREIRKAFIPASEDWILLAADYSQVELRVLADISGDQGLSAAFNSGRDIHTETASEVFGVDSKEVTPDMRREAKVINFGIAYGMSPYGLADDLDISNKEAEKYIDTYFEKFPGVKEYMDYIIEEARDTGYVTTIFNRRRYIPEIRSQNYHRRSFAERTAINTPIQGSAADIMKVAMNEVYDALKDRDFRARLLLQVHDELILEVPHSELQPVARLVKEEMEAAVDLDVPLIVDLQIGENWRDKKDYDLEEGEG